MRALGVCGTLADQEDHGSLQRRHPPAASHGWTFGRQDSTQRLGEEAVCIHFLSLLLRGYMTLGKVFDFYGTQFPHLLKGVIKSLPLGYRN